MQFEALYQELTHNAAILRELLGGITQAEARFKPDPKTWSILEVACHLLDEEREDFRQRLDIILNRPGAPWPPIDPVGWVNARHYDDRQLDEVVDAWVAERERSLAWLRSLSSPDWEAAVAAPWGVMKAGDMLSSWVAHDNLHMRQLVELRRQRLLNLTAPYNVMYAGDW